MMLMKTFLSLAASFAFLILSPACTAQFADEGLPGVLSFGNAPKADDVDVLITAQVMASGADTAVVQVTAEVPEDYYIYSINPSFGAATKIQLTDLAGLTEDGEWKADHEPKVVHDETLGEDIEKFFGKVTWSKTLKGSIPANAEIKGELNGQYCGSGENGVPGECRPIRDRKFTAKVETVAEPSGPNAKEKPADQPTEIAESAVVSSVEVSPKIGYGKSAKSGLIDFKISVSPESPTIGDTLVLSVKATIEEPYHAYAVDQSADSSASPTSIELSSVEGLEAVDKTPIASSPPEETKAADSSLVKVHHGTVEWTQKFKVTARSVKLTGEVAFQLCDDTKCLAPSKAPFELAVLAKEAPARSTDGGTTSTGTSSASNADPNNEPTGDEITPVSSEPQKDTSYYGLIIAAIGAGLLSLFTPCVYPMLPVTVAFFLKQEEKKQGSSLALAIVYSLSMVIAFTIFGVGMSFLFGASSTNVVANNPWLNLFFAGVFMVFALMFFGVFEVHVPSWLLTWTSKREASGGYVGVIFMALTFTLVSFTCTFAFVGQIAILAQGGSLLKAVVGMVAFGATFASPFFLLAMFPSVLSKMPKSGGWMNRVKVTIGLVELAMVLKFLSVSDIGFSSNGLPVFLDRASFLVGWMAISFVTGFYLLGIFRLSSDMEMKGVPVLQVLLSIVFFGVGGYIAVGVFSSSPPSGWVWGQIAALAPPDYQVGGSDSHGGGKKGISIRQDDVLGTVVEHHGLAFGLDFDRAVAEATRTRMALFIDFTGVNCPNCRGMEQDVLSQPQMISLLEKMVRVQLYTDAVPGVSGAAEQDRILKFNRKLQEDWFKDSSLPGYAVVTSDGKHVLSKFAGYDNSRGVDYLKFLNAGLQQFEKVSKRTAASETKQQAGKEGTVKKVMSIREDEVLGVVREYGDLVFGLDFDRAVLGAKRTGKPLFVSFSGIYSMTCLEMEQHVLSQPEIARALSNMVCVQLFTDKLPSSTPASSSTADQARALEFNRKLQEDWFQDMALPAYAIVTSDGKTVLGKFTGYDGSKGVDFARFLNEGMQQFGKLATRYFETRLDEDHLVQAEREKNSTIRDHDVLGAVIEYDGLVFGLDFEKAVKESNRTEKAVFVYFAGVNCPNCKEMERTVLPQPRISSLIKNMVAIQVYVDDIPWIDEPSERNRILEFNRKLQEDLFREDSLPGYALVTSDGKKVLCKFVGYDNSRGVDYLKFLNAGLQQFEKVAKKSSESDADKNSSTAAM